MADKNDLNTSANEGESTLEENFAKLEILLSEMEKEDIGIEDAFNKYAEGMRLIKDCNSKIDRVEKKLKKLAEDLSLSDLDE